jgi:hypothetical protein
LSAVGSAFQLRLRPALVYKAGCTCVTLYCSQIGKRLSQRRATCAVQGYARASSLVNKSGSEPQLELSRSQTSTNHKLLTLCYSSSVVVVWYRVWKFVSPSRRFVCNSHTNSRAILIFQPPINNKPTSL